MSQCTRCLAVLASETRLTQIVCCGVGPVSSPSPSSLASQARPSTAAQNAPSRAGSPASRHRSLNCAIAIEKNLTPRHVTGALVRISAARLPSALAQSVEGDRPPMARSHQGKRDAMRGIGSARLTTRPGRPRDGRGRHDLSWWDLADRKWPPAAAGTVLIVGSAVAFALDGPVAQAAYLRGLHPAAFGFWRAFAGAMVLGGCLAARLRPGAVAAVRRMG